MAVLPAVLGLSLVLEGASLLVAIRAVREGAEVAGLSFMEYVRRGIDPTSVAVMMEDAGACAGLIVAGGGRPAARLSCCASCGGSVSRGIAQRAMPQWHGHPPGLCAMHMQGLHCLGSRKSR
jgi:hypothetical protein